MKSFDPTEPLLHSHHHLDHLVTQLRAAFEANAREDTQKLWSELERDVETHFQAEEEFLFPRFERVDATETRGLRAEHEALRAELSEVGAAVDLKLVRAGVANGFFEMLKAHAAREETMLYRWAKETLLDEARLIEDAIDAAHAPAARPHMHSPR